MHLSLYALPCSTVLLEGLLLWRLSKKALWARYPYLLLFVVYDLFCNLTLFLINGYRPHWFARVYWRIETISLFLRFVVNWEFFRGLFGPGSTLHEFARKVLLTVELVFLPVVLMLGWRQFSSVGLHHSNLYLVVVQYFSLVQALLLLVPAAVASYYRLPVGRNVRGLGLGFGMYLLARAANFASVQAFHGFFLYWWLLTPITFIGMISVWLWAFWDYAPSREPANTIDEAQAYRWKTEWQYLWTRTLRLLRGGIG